MWSRSAATDRPYRSVYLPGTFTVTPRGITVTPDSGQAKTYGTNDPVLTYTATNTVNNDVLSGSLTRTGYGTPAGENVGSYAITQGSLTSANNPNYTVTFNSGPTFAITPASLSVAADPKSKTYGTNDPALTYAASGFVNSTVDGVTISDNAGNSLSGSLTRAGFGTRAGENVGTYAITQGSLAAQNYTIAYTGANLSITPASLSVTADPKSKTYGTNDPALTYAASGFVNGTVDGVTISDNCRQHAERFADPRRLRHAGGRERRLLCDHPRVAGGAELHHRLHGREPRHHAGVAQCDGGPEEQELRHQRSGADLCGRPASSTARWTG